MLLKINIVNRFKLEKAMTVVLVEKACTNINFDILLCHHLWIQDDDEAKLFARVVSDVKRNIKHTFEPYMKHVPSNEHSTDKQAVPDSTPIGVVRSSPVEQFAANVTVSNRDETHLVIENKPGSKRRLFYFIIACAVAVIFGSIMTGVLIIKRKALFSLK